MGGVEDFHVGESVNFVPEWNNRKGRTNTKIQMGRGTTHDSVNPQLGRASRDHLDLDQGSAAVHATDAQMEGSRSAVRDSTLGGVNTSVLNTGGVGLDTQETQDETLQEQHQASDYDSDYDLTNEHSGITLRKDKGRRLPKERPTAGEAPPEGMVPERKHRRSRYSLESEDNQFKIYNINHHDKVMKLTCDDKTFIASVRDEPWVWTQGIRDNLRQISILRAGLNELKELHAVTKEDLRKSEQINAELIDEAEKYASQNTDLKDEVHRLRRRRNAYQADNIALTREVEELKNKSGARDHLLDEDYDSNDDRPMRRTSPANDRRGTRTSHAHRNPVIQTEGDAILPGHTMKTRDVPVFSGERDRHTYDSWRMSISSKIRNNPNYFVNEGRIIDYIRESVSGTAFNIIKARCDPMGTYPYNNHGETLRDLDGAFAVHDLVGRSYAQLGSKAMKMGYTNPRETFDEYYGRFLSCISPLGMDDRHKIETLKQNLPERLAQRIAGLSSTGISFDSFCANLKATDADMRQINEREAEGGLFTRNSRANRAIGTTPTSRAWKKDTPLTTPKVRSAGRDGPKLGPALPPHVTTRIRKEGRCFKCLSSEHMMNDAGATCKNSPFLTAKEMEARLSMINIDWDGEEEDESMEEEEADRDPSDSEN